MQVEHWIYKIPLRLRSLFRRAVVDQELDEELQFHLEQQADDLVGRGLSPEDARHTALRSMHGLAQRKEECRDVRGVSVIDNTIRDVRFAFRVLCKAPGFSGLAIGTLALAIGASAVVFGILNGLVMRPLPVPEASSLYGTTYGDRSPWHSYPNFKDLRKLNRSFIDLAAFRFAFVGVDTGTNTFQSGGFATSGNYFDVLKIHPFLGRFFHETDEKGPNSAPYIVLDYGCWQSQFGSDPQVVGRKVRINKHPFTVIGVAPFGFRGTLAFLQSDFFVPLVNQPQLIENVDLGVRSDNNAIFEEFGHLRSGITPEQAAADFARIGDQLRKVFPREVPAIRSEIVPSGLTSFGGPIRAFVAALMLLSGLILIAACANLGGLFAAHATDRSREVALRMALGANKTRILRQLLTEAILLSLSGGVAGMVIAVLLLTGLSRWHPIPGAPVRIPVAPDASVFLMALGVAVLSGLFFGIVPLRQTLRTDPYEIIKAGPSGRSGRSIQIRDALLIVQVIVCVVLVTASLVAVRGLVRSVRGSFGFDPNSTLVANINFGSSGYSAETSLDMQKRLLGSAKQVRGIESAAWINELPPLVYGADTSVNVFRDETRDFRQTNVAANAARYEVSPGWFETAHTSLLNGRDFSWHDTKETDLVAVVNRTFANQLLGSVRSATTGRFRLSDGRRVLVIGVVEDGKYVFLTERQKPAFFLPITQWPDRTACLLLRYRSSTDEAYILPALRKQVRDLDPSLPEDTQSWYTLMDLILLPARAASVALGVLGFIGIALSVTGVSGMAAYSVSKRLRELGIRSALGATRIELLDSALGRALRLLGFASALGLLLGLGSSRLLSAIVYDPRPLDPIVLGGVVLVMALLGIVATWVPAQRALAVSPAMLLRQE